VLFAPDSFKGSLTSVQVARALADGWARARPDDELLLCPLADGGEGTLEAVAEAGGWDWRETEATDPLGRPILARWLLSTDGTRAAIEMAQSSGLSRVAQGERDAVHATSRGLGDVLRMVAGLGVRDVILGIGGSATTDGGSGLIAGLGAEVRDRLDPVTELRPDFGELDLRVACDVTNPLLGATGAAAVYGPQKGATPADVEILDRKLAAWADRLEAATGRRDRDTPGAGAAGGVGFGLLAIQDAFHSFALRPGVDLVMEAADFAARLARVDLVITGEGRIDAQTAFGKTALGVARRAHAVGKPCIAVGGSVEPEGTAALEAVGATAVPVWESPVPLAVALAAGATPLQACGERLARRLGLDEPGDRRTRPPIARLCRDH